MGLDPRGEFLAGVDSLVLDHRRREFAAACLKDAPAYFWTVPASSTGKYHPSFAAGPGGLVRHTLAAVAIAEEMFAAYPELAARRRDDILVALFLHDTVKHGDGEGYTVDEHPLLPRQRYAKHAAIIGQVTYGRIMGYIATHMGIWGPEDTLPASIPGLRISPAEFVHLSDYLASRKGLETLFGGEQVEATRPA
jgi:hypothetical protein